MIWSGRQKPESEDLSPATYVHGLGSGEPCGGLDENSGWGTQVKTGAGTVLQERTVPHVLIRTTKSDKYDRYLADVFYTDKTGKEQYLNNRLLDEGYAVRVRE